MTNAELIEILKQHDPGESVVLTMTHERILGKWPNERMEENRLIGQIDWIREEQDEEGVNFLILGSGKNR